MEACSMAGQRLLKVVISVMQQPWLINRVYVLPFRRNSTLFEDGNNRTATGILHTLFVESDKNIGNESDNPQKGYVVGKDILWAFANWDW